MKKRRSGLDDTTRQVRRITGRSDNWEPAVERHKMTFDLPIELQNRLRAIAKNESVRQGDLAELALIALCNSIESGKFDLEELKFPIKSLKAEYGLALRAKKFFIS